MGTPRLNILLLGPPLVTLDGKPVKINRRVPKALLYYLASNLQPVTRAAVCDIFWPDEPEEKARKHLREALSGLRTDLGIHEVVKTVDEQLFINLEQCYLDTEEYDRIVYPLLKSSELNSSGRLPDWMTGQLKHAIELCRTPYFMQGMQLPGSPGFERWLEFTNNTLNFSRSKIIERLIDHSISNGDLDEAMLWLGKGLETDPLDQEKNFLALTCLRDKGEIQQLVDHVNYLEGLYKEREETIPAQFIQLRSQAEESRNVSVNIPESIWPVPKQATPKFVSRQEEFNVLNRLMRRKGVVHLRGEVGVGKTRLLKEFFDQQLYAPRLVYCLAHQVATRVPFQTLVEGLEKVIRPEDWNMIEEKDREILSNFFHHHLQNSESPASMDGDKRWLPVMQDSFYAFLRLMEKVAIKRPVLFILDDAWWSDEASLTLLWFLVENKYFKKHGTLIIVTRLERSNEILNQMIINLKRSNELETVNLKNFTYEETGQFIYQMTGKNPDPAFQQKMLVNTGGNPFFLVECIREMKNSDLETSSITEKDQRAIPESIEGLVWEKVHLLKPDTVKVLRAAAVLGNIFASDVLELMVQTGKEAYLTALEEIKKAGFISVDMQVKPAGGYAFCHDIERQYIEQSLDPARRRDLHLKAAGAIIKRRGKMPELTSKLARHYEVAGELVQAADCWLEAGRYARSVPTREDIYSAYSNALNIIQQAPYLFIEDFVYNVVSEWGDYAYDLADEQTCQLVYQNGLNIGEQRQSSLLIGTALSGLGRTAGLGFDFKASEDYFQRATYQLIKAAHVGELTEVYSRIGILNFKRDDYVKATQAFEEGIKFVGNPNDMRQIEARINILTQHCIILCFMGWPKRAHELALEMVGDSQLVIRRSARLQSGAVFALTQYFNGRFLEAINTCQDLESLSGDLQIRVWQSLMDVTLARSYLLTGDLDKAWVHVNRAVEREADFALEKFYDVARQIKGDFYRFLDEQEKALELYQAIIDTGFQNPQAIECYHYKGISLASMGRIDEALSSIDECIERASRQGLHGVELNAKIRKPFLSKDWIDAAQFEQHTRLVLDDIKNRGLMDSETFEWLVQGQAAEIRGDRETAIGLYQEMDELFTNSGKIWFVLYVLKKIINLAGPQSSQGRKARERVEQIFESLSQHALTQPVKGMFSKFRKKWSKSQWLCQ